MTPLLACPHCGLPLERQDRTWRCGSGHSFDVARQGYVNLLAGRAAHPGDTAAMLDARSAVLDAGVLAPVTSALVRACADVGPGALVEVGAGTAHHLAAVRRALGDRDALALDSSPAAARRAARADPRVLSAVTDAWARWPVLDEVAARVLWVFAPRHAAEAARVLRPDGRLVVVVPAAEHLEELREPLGLLSVPQDKAERLPDELAPHLEPDGLERVREAVHVPRALAVDLALMGPAGHHSPAEELRERAAALPATVAVTVAVAVLRFRRAAG